MIPRRVAQLGRTIFPRGLWEGPADRKWVALTFDDGPDARMTPLVLDELRRLDVPATFFLVGDRMRRRPDLVRRAHGAGHEIGNHTWSHRPLALGWCASPAAEVARTEELLERLSPGSQRIFRPAFGAIGPGGPQALERHALFPVYWSVLPADWNPTPAEEVARRVLAEVHPGAVVVLHAGRPWHRGTVEALPALVETLRERGYELVPVSRMLEAAGHEVGVRG